MSEAMSPVNTVDPDLALSEAKHRVLKIQTKLHGRTCEILTRLTGLVESPVPGNRHAGFGKRPEETERSKDRNRAPGRLHQAVSSGRVLNACPRS